MTAQKAFDILVCGATGFTGKLVLEYLHQQAPKQAFSYAVAGRNRQKLDQTVKELGIEPKEIVVVDAQDEEGLRQAVRRCKVVISLVGPYLRHGYPLAKVVAEEGVDYVDLTGESPFIVNSIKRNSSSALSTRSILIHSAGFDSVPSDLCAFLAVQQLKKQLGPGNEDQVGQVTTMVSCAGGMSGGTFASLMAILEAGGEDRSVAADPYATSPIKGLDRPSLPLAQSLTYRGRKQYGFFWVMGPGNSQLVRRTWGLLQTADDPEAKKLAYGRNFRYQETVKRIGGMRVRGPVGAVLVNVCFYTMFALLYLPPIRYLAKRFGLQSGDGPSKEEREAGWFKLETVARSVDGKEEARAVMKGKGDPGYLGTSLMISECALSLLQDRPAGRLPPLAQQGGHLTPVTALGETLKERLERTGAFEFEVEGGKSE
ncbi:hypothetical protein JCM10207_002372 [Rhodosporidiobolus poonsookiae]